MAMRGTGASTISSYRFHVPPVDPVLPMVITTLA